MKKYKLHEIANECMEQLKNGALLTVKGQNKVNTMTIAWGFIGMMWNKPSAIVAVRKSRYTYELMEEAKDFTLSFPDDANSLKKELMYCGNHSGKNIDKFKESGLNIIPSYHVGSPIIKECNLFIEARIVYRQEMDPKFLYGQENMAHYQKSEDYHVYYFGEIVEIYKSNG